MNDEIDYDPDKSPYVRSVEEVQAATKGLLDALGTSKRALKQRPHLPEPTNWTLEAETVEAAFDSITLRLAFAYDWFAPHHTKLTAYNEDILKPFLAGDLASQASIIKQQVEVPYDQSLDVVIDATVAAVEALRADISGNKNTVWKHIANAMYHLGKLEVIFLMKSMAKELHRTNGQKAAGTKVGPETLIELARKLAEEGSHRSRQHAADAIEPKIVAEATRIGYHWRADLPATAIYRWLKGFRPKK